MNNNQRRNQIAINQFRKELQSMFDDIYEIDKKVLNKAVNVGAAYARRNTPVDTGFMRKSWHVTRTQKTAQGAEKELNNTADYSSYVNYGHRIVKGGETKGWVKCKYILEKAINSVNKSMEREFKKEVERVNKKHDK